MLEIFDTICAHAHHGGFNVIYGNPGVGKSVIKEHIEALHSERENVIISFSRTMHTYNQIILQMADALKIETSTKKIETEIIRYAHAVHNSSKKLFVVIDEAHLLHPEVMRKLRLFLDQFPRRYTLVLFGQSGLMHLLALKHNSDIKTRITYSAHLKPLTDEAMEAFILKELQESKIGVQVFDEAAIELITRAVEGNLRLCRNLAYYSLVDACYDEAKRVTPHHVNRILMMPHWRTQKEIYQHAAKEDQSK